MMRGASRWRSAESERKGGERGDCVVCLVA